MSVELNGWYWTKDCDNDPWRLTRFKRGIDRQGDTRQWYAVIGPQVPTPAEMQATELKLAKLQNLVDDLDETLSETREERDRLRAEAEGLRPKEKSEWRFFDAKDRDVWVMSHRGGFLYSPLRRTISETIANIGQCISDGDTALAASDAYALLADWPEGQAKFRELTGYVPPTCKESLPVQPEERVRCYLGRDGKLRCYDGYEECLFLDHHEDVHLAQPEQLTIEDGHKRIPLTEALEIVRDRPKQIKKLREMAGIVTPKEAVRCYRNEDNRNVWIYTDTEQKCFNVTNGGDWFEAIDQEHRSSHIPCTLAEARTLLADRPKSLAEFDRSCWRCRAKK